jgi:diguanylate cyclase (GGDEF)-like protein/PAS domain S-box-containing protein
LRIALLRPSTAKPPRDAAAPTDPGRRAVLFASVMANAKDAVVVTEAEPVDLASGGPRILYVNEAFTAMTGYSSDEAVGRTPRLLQSPRTDGDELDRLRLALAAWEPVEVELLNVRKDGTEFWVQFIIVPVTDEAGWFTHWVSIQRDVTERHRRHDELAAMVRGTTEVVLIVDIDGTIRASSPAADRSLAPHGQELAGACLSDFVVPEEQETVREALRALARPDAVATEREILLRTTSGWRWFEAAMRLATVDETGARIVVTAVDVTERRRVRAALRQAQHRFRGAFEDAPIGMAVHGRDGALLEVNAQLCRLLGRDEEKLLTLGLDDLVHPDDRRESQAERRQVIAGSISVGRRETRLLHADGRVVGVMLSSSIVRRDDEQVELVVHIEDISERKALEARLTHQALHDSLTHLPNRALFVDRLEVALRRGERDGSPVSVLFLDLDDFKAINDTRGHEVGDGVLTAMAKRLAALVRPGDTAARFGGDEFTVLCEGADADEARLVAERVAEAIEAPITLPNQGDMRLRASIGIAAAVSSAMTAEMLLRDADLAMYAAKGTDRRIELFEERLRSRKVARINHEQELTRALDRDELELHYQPLASLTGDSGRPVEFEALVRWRHPERGLLLPAAFILLAEESGLIAAVDRWVLHRACADVARIARAGAKVWVNMSLRSLSELHLVEQVQTSLAAAGIPATSLGLELTESAVGAGGDQMRTVVEQLRGLGVELAADDFGTGYSSLSSLIERPVDVLKIDQSFISTLPSTESVAVVRAIVAMAAALGLQTVAEGVEQDAQLTALRDLGCDRVQGFLLARPMELAALIEYFADRPDAPFLRTDEDARRLVFTTMGHPHRV